MRVRSMVLALIVMLVPLLAKAQVEPIVGRTQRVSVPSAETDGPSRNPSISESGRYVAFESDAANLVPGDTNGATDVFVRDRLLGKTIRVSVGQGSTQANGASRNASISADGAVVAFESDATNLVAGDTNGATDVFAFSAGEVERVSVSSGGAQATGASRRPSISACPSTAACRVDHTDGRYIAFDSGAPDLVIGDANNSLDVFVFDRFTGETTRVSVTGGGSEADGASYSASISENGQYIAFVSTAPNLGGGGTANIFRRDVCTDAVACSHPTTAMVSYPPAATSREVAQTFAHDGASFAPAITGEARFRGTGAPADVIAFASSASHFVSDSGNDLDTNESDDVFVYDALRGGCVQATVVFTVPGRTETVGRCGLGQKYAIGRASLRTSANAAHGLTREAHGASEDPSIAYGGKVIAFSSTASDLIEGDDNGTQDVFLHDRNSGTATYCETLTAAGGTCTVRVPYEEGTTTCEKSDGLCALLSVPSEPIRSSTILISATPLGTPGNGASSKPSISTGGRYVAFQSDASNLVDGDASGTTDIYVRDRDGDGDGTPDEPGEVTTSRVSLPFTGLEAERISQKPSISPDGRFVAFQSDSCTLVGLDEDANAICESGDTNQATDIFVFDRALARLSRVSVSTTFEPGNGPSTAPSISDGGRFVAFQSGASNLVPGDTNGVTDIFVRDRDTDGDTIFDEPGAVATIRVSVSATGVEGSAGSRTPAISADGRVVAFVSFASNLVPGDNGGYADVFIRNLATSATSLVSRGVTQGNASSDSPSLSKDGRLVAFDSVASNLVPGDTNGRADVFVRDRALGTTQLISVATNGGPVNGSSIRPSISGDGLRVAFESAGSNIVTGDTNGVSDIFVRSLCPMPPGNCSPETVRASEPAVGPATRVGANGPSAEASISADGSHVAFTSSASNLVLDDSNACGASPTCADVFVRLLSGPLTGNIASLQADTYRVSIADDGSQSDNASFEPSISADGSLTAFSSFARNLVLGDTNGCGDVFVRWVEDPRRVVAAKSPP